MVLPKALHKFLSKQYATQYIIITNMFKRNRAEFLEKTSNQNAINKIYQTTHLAKWLTCRGGYITYLVKAIDIFHTFLFSHVAVFTYQLFLCILRA